MTRAVTLEQIASRRRSPHTSLSRKLTTSNSTTTTTKPSYETAKRLAAQHAVQTCFDVDKHKVIGVGSGTTVEYVVEELKRKLARSTTQQQQQSHVFVPTGRQSRAACARQELPVADMTDDVDENLQLIKGGGACHLQEKLVMLKSKYNVIVADWRKESKMLCRGAWQQGVPLEVVPMATDLAIRSIQVLYGKRVQALVRINTIDSQPVVTDNGNVVIDVTGLPPFDNVETVSKIAQQLKLVTGVVEVGLFVDLTDEVFFGQQASVSGAMTDRRRGTKPMQDSTDQLGHFDQREGLDVDDREQGSNRTDPIDPLSDDSLSALRRLARYKPPRDPWPSDNRAAVLVALFGSRTGKNLNVLLSTRALTLRTFPGNVALPGGKQDDGDMTLEATARREAFEEIGLPPNPNVVRYLTTLPPFLARSLLLVTPVVVFILDSSLKPNLNPDEVDDVFSFPLRGFLQHKGTTQVLGTSVPDEVLKGIKEYHMHIDYPWFDNVPHRYHHFEAKPKPITGLTAEILIHVAQIAYNEKAEFEVYAPDEWPQKPLIERAMKDPKWKAQTKRKQVGPVVGNNSKL
ncbi:8-oxo-dGTP diphosphatase [Microbotryomycetes sp. JL221]|nr:8-oxo-dGTP diphosphatase [Microbotryomycetes sp. JL221]